MSFTSVLFTLNAKVNTIKILDRDTRALIEKKLDYGMLFVDPAQVGSDRKEIISEGYTSSYYTQSDFKTAENNVYLIYDDVVYALVKQSNNHQNIGGSNLNHYVYKARVVQDDFDRVLEA